MHKKLFLASAGALALSGSALAADLLPPPPPPPIFTWTGPYVSGQIGYAWGPSTLDLIGFNPSNRALFVASVGGSPSGVIGGAHVGYLYQINQWAVGIEGSVDGPSLRANALIVLPAFLGRDILAAHATADVQGSIRGKLGFAWDRALIYGTGGVAFGGSAQICFLADSTGHSSTSPLPTAFFRTPA